MIPPPEGCKAGGRSDRPRKGAASGDICAAVPFSLERVVVETAFDALLAKALTAKAAPIGAALCVSGLALLTD